MKKTLINITFRQQHVLGFLSEELGVTLSELIRRALDDYIENEVKRGNLIRYTLSVGEKAAVIETPKASYDRMVAYLKDHPDGVLKMIDN